MDVYVVDDGSSDGTSSAIRKEFPKVCILRGDGSLFWGGGMRLAFDEAIKGAYDFYLWVNDDIKLSADAVSKSLACYDDIASRSGRPPVVVGVFADPANGKTAYGGWKSRGKVFPSRFRRIDSGQKPRECDTANGNFVLIPAAVPDSIGNVDGNLVHTMGDFDYFLRASAAGFPIWSMPGTLGHCEPNPSHLEQAFARNGVLDAWRYYVSTKCLPIKAWTRFQRRHGGPLWIVTLVSPYVRFWLIALRKGLGFRTR